MRDARPSSLSVFQPWSIWASMQSWNGGSARNRSAMSSARSPSMTCSSDSVASNVGVLRLLSSVVRGSSGENVRRAPVHVLECVGELLDHGEEHLVGRSDVSELTDDLTDEVGDEL